MLLQLALLLAAAGCSRTEQHPDWVIRARLVFMSEDLSSERPPLPPTRFRLSFPYIAGDIYGPATTGDYISPLLGPDYRLEIDLNQSHRALLASLEKTNFSLPYLHIEPAAARVARLAPMILQADGIEPLGRLEWLDPDSKQVLLLLYLDRPATISGRSNSAARPLRYAIHARAAGYVWVGRQTGADEEVYTVLPRPARLLLAVRPEQP
jgi:hypothetical protein